MITAPNRARIESMPLVVIRGVIIVPTRCKDDFGGGMAFVFKLAFVVVLLGRTKFALPTTQTLFELFGSTSNQLITLSSRQLKEIRQDILRYAFQFVSLAVLCIVDERLEAAMI